MFDKLADGVIRHHKKIIVAWMLALVLSVPLMMRISEVIVYEETAFAPEGLESVKAQEIIDEEFPGSIANSTAIIVVQSPDVTSVDVKDFALSLEENVTADPEIKYLQSFNSIYTVVRGILVSTVDGLATALHQIETRTNGTCFMLYGIPGIYVQAWSASGGDDVAANITAYNTLDATIDSGIENGTINQTTADLMRAYYFLFYSNWTSTVGNALLVADPPLRAQVAIDNATLTITMNMPPLDGVFVQSIWQGFNLTSWSNMTLIHEFAVATTSSMLGVNDMGFMEDVYLLGPAPTLWEIFSFSVNVVRNGTLSLYPVEIPAKIYSGFISPDNGTMLLIIGFTRGANEIGGGDEITENIGVIRATVADIKAALGDGMTVYVSGDAALSADVAEQVATDIERVDPVTVALVIILLSLFFLSIVTPFVPLLVIGFAILVSQGIIFIVGTYVASIHYSAIMIMFPLILAVGVDYSIFIIARYREERKEGRNREEAVRTSLTWAGESIATSGGVVMVSFGALSIASFGMMRTLGLAMMIGVAMALVAALTFLPSLLLVLGNRIFWPTRDFRRRTWLDSKNNASRNNESGPPDKKSGKSKAEKRAEMRRKRGYFGRAARFSIRHAKAIVLIALLVSVPTTYAVLNLESSFDFIAAMPETESKLGMDAMGEGFGRGNIMRSYVVVQTEDELFDGTTFDEETLDSIDNLTARIEALDNIDRVDSSLHQIGTRIDKVSWQGLSDLVRDTMIAQAIGEDNNTVLLTVILEDEPFSPTSMQTMPAIRTEIERVRKDESPLTSANILIGGATASLKDIQDSMAGDFNNMVVIVIIGIFILLLIVLGSVLIPLRLILTILLSISWALALTMFLFVWLNGIPVIWLMPMILFIIIMGLGMDYDIFLVTRIREEVSKGASDEAAIVKAVERTGGIITACGMIMAGAFASLMLSSMGLLQEFGFGLAFAILIDAMIIRIYLVPAIMILLKRWNWWAPGKLQRVRLEDKKALKKTREEKKDKNTAKAEAKKINKEAKTKAKVKEKTKQKSE